MSTISRRAFLKTVGVGALSVAAMSVLAGCDVTKTETPVVTGSVAANVGQTYIVGDCAVVTDASVSSKEIAVDDAWFTDFETAYKKVIANSSAYEDASDDLKAAAMADATAAANKNNKNVEQEISFQVTNYGDSAMIVATRAYETSNSVVFTASCNGAAVNCVVDKTVVEPTGSAATIKCTLTLPCNPEKFAVTVALPGGTKVLEYTFENSNYVNVSEYKPA